MRMLIVNPIAGCGYALKVMEQVQSVLTARNLPFRVMRTEYPGYAAKLAREAVEMGCEAVYVIGGDGTFSEAARGLAGSGIPIGLIPAGTGNDFVKTLGTPKEPMAALDFILSHEPRPCDAIDLNGQMFLNVAGAGFDVTVLENVADFGGKIRGLLPYLVGLIRAIWKHQPLQLTYTVDGKTWMERRRRRTHCCALRRTESGLAAASRFAPMLCRMTAKSTSWSSGTSRGGKCRTISCA